MTKRPYLDLIDGPSVIDLQGTDATTAQFSGVLDTRGGKSLGLFVEASSSSSDGLQCTVLTRLADTPWMVTVPIEAFTDSGEPLLSYGTKWTALSTGIAVTYVFLGLLDETVIVIQPLGTGAPSTVSTNFTDPDADLQFTADIINGSLGGGDFGDSFAVRFVDPGAPDQVLGLSSEDGYIIDINLGTDGGGLVTSTAADIAQLFGGVAGPGPGFSKTAPWPVTTELLGAGTGLVEATGVLQLTGGDSGATGVAYRVRGSA